jgi:hypothetical protein
MSTTTVPSRPDTIAGVTRLVENPPEPNWPEPLIPKHDTVPPETSTHVKATPADTEAASVIKGTTVGARFSPVVIACDSWPELFLPKHVTVLSASAAQVWVPPAEMETALLPNPVVIVGSYRFNTVPSPNRPLVPSPQHHALPSVDTAHT